jgi:transcriptional regulator with XRE-family HTH domain
VPYNGHPDAVEEGLAMAKRKIQVNEKGESFGDRLARLRQAAGLSQRDLAAEVGISQRMVAYYEKETGHPPTHLFPLLAKALHVSADQLLGLETVKENGRTRDNRLWRRFSQVEKLPASERKQIVQFLDAFLEREKLRKAK